MQMVIQQKLLEFTDNLVMGILNVTPDSFYSESRASTNKEILLKAEKMLSEGADILDIGGYSSRPGAADLPIEEEINRIEASVLLIKKEYPNALVSLDTFRSEVAKVGIESGADIINDISAGNIDSKLPDIVAHYKVPYIIMHMRGTPQTMQSDTTYENLMQELITYFDKKIKSFQKMGIHDLIIDPGFGFSKTVEQNFDIIKNFELLQMFNIPILAGISRKSFIQKTLNVNADDTLFGTTALHAVLLQKGVNILRTHDVKEAKETVQLQKALS